MSEFRKSFLSCPVARGYRSMIFSYHFLYRQYIMLQTSRIPFPFYILLVRIWFAEDGSCNPSKSAHTISAAPYSWSFLIKLAINFDPGLLGKPLNYWCVSFETEYILGCLLCCVLCCLNSQVVVHCLHWKDEVDIRDPFVQCQDSLNQCPMPIKILEWMNYGEICSTVN